MRRFLGAALLATDERFAALRFTDALRLGAAFLAATLRLGAALLAATFLLGAALLAATFLLGAALFTDAARLGAAFLAAALRLGAAFLAEDTLLEADLRAVVLRFAAAFFLFGAAENAPITLCNADASTPSSGFLRREAVFLAAPRFTDFLATLRFAVAFFFITMNSPFLELRILCFMHTLFTHLLLSKRQLFSRALIQEYMISFSKINYCAIKK